MISVKEAGAFALAFPLVEELPHFQKRSYRVKKKIFATIDEDKKLLMVKLMKEEQLVFCSSGNKIIYPVKGAWGKQGYTFIELPLVDKRTCKAAIKSAYNTLVGK